MNSAVHQFIAARESEETFICNERKKELEEIANNIADKLRTDGESNVVIICTHNSRRSQLGEFIVRIAAHHYNIPHIRSYSGGTEATAFFPGMVSALERTGFSFSKGDDTSNPHYIFQSEENDLVQPMFSKKYDDKFNPKSGFIAIMVCDHADQNCPIVLGAASRFSLPYTDPKVADHTPQINNVYDEKVKEMGREFIYLIRRIKKLLP